MVEATKQISTTQKASTSAPSDRRWAMRSTCNLHPPLLFRSGIVAAPIIRGAMVHWLYAARCYSAKGVASLPSGRTQLLTALSRHRCEDAKEASDLDQMKRWALALEDPFARSQPEAHFTGSAVVIDPVGERVCLVRHRKLDRWLQPGGHAEPGDGGSIEQTALREAGEETGCRVLLHPSAPRPLDLDVHAIPARPGEPAHRHLDVRFLVVAHDPEQLSHDCAESRCAKWLSWDEALALVDEPALRRLLRKARASAGSAGGEGNANFEYGQPRR